MTKNLGRFLMPKIMRRGFQDMKDIRPDQIGRADLVFRGRMSKTPFLDHPAFKYSFKHSGYSKYSYGAVTGPSISISNIFHEIAHSIEFAMSGDDLLQRSRGGKYQFNVNYKAINGELYIEPATTQITLRECRTFAIQIKFMHMVGFKTNLEKFARYSAKLTTWLPDWYLVEGDTQDERVKWCCDFILSYYSKLNSNELYESFGKWLDEIHPIQNSSLAK